MDVRLPDGTIIRGVPDGTTKAELVEKLKRNGYNVPAEMEAAAKPSAPKPSVVQQALGDLGAGAIRGAGSIGATLLTPVDMLMGKTQSIGNPERRAAMDEALKSMGFGTDSAAFGAGKLGGEIAGTAGAGGLLGKALAPVASRAPGMVEAIASSGMKAGGLTGAAGLGARTVGGGITGGLAAAAINPEDAAIGAATGAALPGALQVAGKAGQVVGSALRPSVSNPQLAEKAIKQYGIPLSPSDISASGMVKGARSALDDSWIVGGMGRKQKEAAQEAFNKAIGATFGAPAPKLTPSVVDAAKSRLGSEFDRIWGGNTLKLDAGFVQDLSRIRADAAGKLNPEQAAQVEKTIQNLLQKAQGLDIDGAFANNWQSELRMISESEKGLHQKLLQDLRRSTIDAFNRSVSPADAAALTMNRSQYKAYKTIQPLLEGAEAGVAGRESGDIAAGLLPQAVRKSYGSGISKSPFADLSQIGSQFMTDRVPRTGGSARAAVQNLAIGGGLMANPMLTGAGLVGATGLEALLSSPAAARAMLPGAASPQSLLLQEQIRQLLARSAPAIAADQ